jgi:hypothetical protein
MNMRSFRSCKLVYVALFAFALLLLPASKLHAATTLAAPQLVQCTEASGTVMAANLPTGAVIHYSVQVGVNGGVRSGEYSLNSSNRYYIIWVEESDIAVTYSAYATYQGATSATTTVTVPAE